MDDSAQRMTTAKDDHLALTLMTMWAPSTGRAMPGHPPRFLSERELIDFWAEQLISLPSA